MGPTYEYPRAFGAAIKNAEEEGDIFQTGTASWYGPNFHGKRTANGEIYDMNKLTAAHRELPFHTIVEVNNLENNKRVLVRINDRGPFINDRIIDLSYKAAGRIGITGPGTAMVSLKIVKLRGKIAGSVNEVQIPITPAVFEKNNGWYIQAGAFANRDNAGKMLRRLKQALPRVVFVIYFQDNLFKVKTEPIFIRSLAEAYKKTLGNYGIEVLIIEETGE